MENKKSPKGRKRTSKGIVISSGASPMDEHFWDCSVCTFRNNAEAFKCSMCDVRKGTSTRKPRLNPDIVAAQQAQQAITPPPLSTTPTPSSSTWSGDEGGGNVEGENDLESSGFATLKSNKKLKDLKMTSKKESTRQSTVNQIPRLKNVNRNAATYHSVTVNDLTVVITEFQPKVKKERKIKGVSKVGSSQTFDEDSSRTSRSPSESGDGITSDENSLPHPNSNGNLPLDTGSGFL